MKYKVVITIFTLLALSKRFLVLSVKAILQ
jgi:hypothetical protein